MDEIPFWRRKTLTEMNEAEWESLCDGCGRCCLVKLEEDIPAAQIKAGVNPAIYYTDVGCKLLDGETCGCRDYPNRGRKVPDCVKLTPKTIAKVGWLPPTCAYKLIERGRDLYWWHPLVSGDPDTVHAAGISVRGRVYASEEEIPAQEAEERIVSWPLRWPKRAREPQAPKEPRAPKQPQAPKPNESAAAVQERSRRRPSGGP